jgi:hypothetical protein
MYLSSVPLAPYCFLLYNITYMQTFHDHKLWQDAYVAVMDVFEQTSQSDGEIIPELRHLSLTILSTIADAVSRVDRKERYLKLHDAMGSVASMRSLLSVAWGRQAVTDDVFRKIDGAYEKLGKEIVATR